MYGTAELGRDQPAEPSASPLGPSCSAAGAAPLSALHQRGSPSVLSKRGWSVRGTPRAARGRMLGRAVPGSKPRAAALLQQPGLCLYIAGAAASSRPARPLPPAAATAPPRPRPLAPSLHREDVSVPGDSKSYSRKKAAIWNSSTLSGIGLAVYLSFVSVVRLGLCVPEGFWVRGPLISRQKNATRSYAWGSVVLQINSRIL